jgi:hypothetical protein
VTFYGVRLWKYYIRVKNCAKKDFRGWIFKWVCTTVFSPQAENLENISTNIVLPLQILGQNLQFPGKFAERPFFLLFFLLFLGIFKNQKFRSAAYDLGRHMICYIHNMYSRYIVNQIWNHVFKSIILLWEEMYFNRYIRNMFPIKK